jgi:hypothetical protein
MQDIIGRMKAGDVATSAATGVAAAGVTSEADEADRRSLSLLNKLIGAQILVQCTESAFAAAAAPPEDAKSTSFHETSQHRSADGSTVSRTNRLGNKWTTGSVDSGKDQETGAQWTTRRSSSAVSTLTTLTTTTNAAASSPSSSSSLKNNGDIQEQESQQQQQQQKNPSIRSGMASAAVATSTSTSSSSSSCVGGNQLIDGVDIDTCTDDYKLNELLDNCNDYEGRRRIRARIKVLLSTNQAESIKQGATGGGKAVSSSRPSTFGSVSSKTEVTTRQQSTYRSSHQQQPNQSAFSKFQQLDQQQVKATPR